MSGRHPVTVILRFLLLPLLPVRCGHGRFPAYNMHPTVTHYDAGKSNVRTYLFRDYTSELAQAHGVRAAYPSFGIEYIQNVLQTNINSAFLALT